MRDNLATFKIWAPDHTLWAAWAKPVLFIHSPYRDSALPDIPEIDWISKAEPHTMIVVDLPGEEGVEEGLALARLGYRPVPLYNGTSGPNDHSKVVKVEDIATALFEGADELYALNLSPSAPPAFLLDSNRMRGSRKEPGRYDNRWCVFPQDMPSASCLLQNGIREIIVRSDIIRDDLTHILCRYQEEGIEIYLCRDDGPPKKTTVTKPSQFKSLAYRFLVIWGLTRNAAGGFGGRIPESDGVHGFG